MEALATVFASVPLPYEIITIPADDAMPGRRNDSYGAHLYGVWPDTVQKCLEEAGFRFLVYPDMANIVTGSKFKLDDLQKIKIWCRVAHFDAVVRIGSKCELHFRMLELQKKTGHPVPFYPKTYYPPDEYEELVAAWQKVPIWIVKPPALSRARNLRIARSATEDAPMLPFIVQEYVPRPLLILGRKFDVRLYALVSMATPMTVYFHDNGLALFATTAYDEEGDLSDLTKHITNFEVNKDSPNFVACEDTDEKPENSKWSLPFLMKYLADQGLDAVKIRKEMEDAATAGIIAGMCAVRREHKRNVRAKRRCSYEMLGVDVMLDQDMKAWLLEINVSPGMTGASGLDRYIKNQVTRDTFNLVRLVDFTVEKPDPCSQYVKIERVIRQSVNAERRAAVKAGDVKPWDAPVFADYMIAREFVDEQMRKRRYHRVYPKRKDMDKFAYCFDEFDYEDVVLSEFVKMDNETRFSTLIDNLDVVYHGLQLQEPDKSRRGNCNVQ